MLIASLLISLNDAASMWMAASYPVGEIIFVRSLCVLLVVALSTLGRGTLGSLRPRSFKRQFTRGIFYALSSILFLLSLTLLALPVAVAVSLGSPLIVTALASLMLGERVDWRRWVAVVVGLAGVLLVTDPFASKWGWGVLVALAGAAAGALKDIHTRRISSSETTPSILVFGMVLLAAAGLCTAPFGWTWPAPMHLAAFALFGVSFGAAHYLIIEAFRSAEAAIVSPIQYSMLAWSSLLGFTFWGNVPSIPSLLGSLTIAGSTAYVMLWRKRDALQRSKELIGRP